jgi:uncharacterized membrane protein YgaE (UPF0421/DUF939 family)
MQFASFASPKRLLTLTFLGVVLASQTAFLAPSIDGDFSSVENSSLETTDILAASSSSEVDGSHQFYLQ